MLVMMQNNFVVYLPVGLMIMYILNTFRCIVKLSLVLVLFLFYNGNSNDSAVYFKVLQSYYNLI